MPNTGSYNGGDPTDFVTNGGLFFNGDVILGRNIQTFSSRFYAAGQVNVGPNNAISLLPSAAVSPITYGGPGGTGSFEVTDNELANMTANQVFIGAPFGVGIDGVLGNNIQGLPYLLIIGGDTLYEMGYTFDANVLPFFNNIVP
jgi:hypothetical protein